LLRSNAIWRFYWCYFQFIYEPAIKRAGLHPVRADEDVFGTGKIIGQIWSGINAAKVLVAELSDLLRRKWPFLGPEVDRESF
jgi:hypothetical protein